MKTLHIVSVGTSIFSNFDKAAGDSGFKVFGNHMSGFKWESFNKIFLPKEAGSGGKILSLMQAEDFHEKLNPLKNQGVKLEDNERKGLHKLSAELNSLYNCLSEDQGPKYFESVDTLFRNREQDRILFLTSDSDDGKIAAVLNANCISENPVLEWMEGDLSDIGASDKRCFVSLIPRLNTADSSKEAETEIYEKIGRLVQEIAKDAHGFQRFVFHLSGGYKFAIPYFIDMAEWVWMAKCIETAGGMSHVNVRIVFTHEEENERRLRDIHIPQYPSDFPKQIRTGLANNTDLLGKVIINGVVTPYGKGIKKALNVN